MLLFDFVNDKFPSLKTMFDLVFSLNVSFFECNNLYIPMNKQSTYVSWVLWFSFDHKIFVHKREIEKKHISILRFVKVFAKLMYVCQKWCHLKTIHGVFVLRWKIFHFILINICSCSQHNRKKKHLSDFRHFTWIDGRLVTHNSNNVSGKVRNIIQKIILNSFLNELLLYLTIAHMRAIRNRTLLCIVIHRCYGIPYRTDAFKEKRIKYRNSFTPATK